MQLAAVLFAVAAALLQWWRLQSLMATYDQGIFLQVLWNGLHGHPFESTLSSQLSTNVVHSGELPSLGYHRLSQHFTPILALWIPLVGLLGIWALPMLQVALITAAGLVLYKLAKESLQPELAATITLAFYGANAVVAPTLGNFTDLCQLPLLVFLLLYGLQRKQRWLVAISAGLIPMVREDTGVVLASVGIWLAIRHPKRWLLAAGMIGYGLGWVALVTNQLMPLFGDDNAKRFMVSNFGQFAPGASRASSVDIARQVFSQPLILLRELVSPPGQTLLYLLAQSLPLLLLPLLSIDAWLLMGLPLLGLLLARGSNDPLSINIRYTFLVVPGLFAGTILWWKQRQQLFAAPRLRQLWHGCILLSLLFAITANQNRSFSFLIPDSVQPWVYANPVSLWQHGQAARAALQVIPSDASVSATTNLVPWLAQRKVLVRFPTTAYLDGQRQEQPVDWVSIDFNRLARYAAAFPRDQGTLTKALRWLQKSSNQYGVMAIGDGVVVLQRGGTTESAQAKQLQALIQPLQQQQPTRIKTKTKSKTQPETP